MEKLEFKGTKGSWELRGSRIFIKDTFLSIAEVHVQSNYELVTFKPKQDLEAIANAKLIASAPDLLKALSDIIESIDNDFGAFKGVDKESLYIKHAKQAIEKALK